MLRVRPFQDSDTASVVALWRACGLTRPWNDPHRDVERKLAEQPELFLVAEHEDEDEDEDGGAVVGTAMAGYDGHRGWVHYVAVDPARQGDGVGRALMAEAERLLEARGVPKVMLMVRAGNEAVLGFYDALGYAPDDVVVLGKRLIAD